MTVEPSAYAAGLREYAGGVLDPHSLHAWMIQRLVLDLKLEHARAVEVVETVLEHERAAARHRTAGLWTSSRAALACIHGHGRAA